MGSTSIIAVALGLPGPIDPEEERENGTREDVAELKKVSRSGVATVVSDDCDF
jgi:hypothetical protein